MSQHSAGELKFNLGQFETTSLWVSKLTRAGIMVVIGPERLHSDLVQLLAIVYTEKLFVPVCIFFSFQFLCLCLGDKILGPTKFYLLEVSSKFILS